MKPIPALAPFAWLYGAGVRIRNTLYDLNWFYSVDFTDVVKIVSVGNIVAGGSGKSPFVSYLASRFSSLGYSVTILSRGYGRKSKGPLIVSDGKSILSDVYLAGDEPYMLALENREVPVVVSEDRITGVLKILKEFSPRLILMDDGFQHRRLRRDLDIVLHPAMSSSLYSVLLPAGYLREPLQSLRRASFIVLTNGSEEEYRRCRKDLQSTIAGLNDQMFFSTLYDYQLMFWNGAGFVEVKNDSFYNNFIGITAIARPESFFHSCHQQNLTLKQTYTYPDHYYFSAKDLQLWEETAILKQTDKIICTMKDAVKLIPLLKHSHLTLYVLKQRVSVKEENLFWNKLIQKLQLDKEITWL